MKRLATLLGVVAAFVLPMTGVPQAKADLCVYPREIIIDYKGWPIIGQPGYYQCGGPIWGWTPEAGETIGQKIIHCDGSEETWGQICEPNNGYNQVQHEGAYCDCGPDQP